MLIRIRETQELRELSIVNHMNGINYTQDMLGNNGALHYNEETEEHEMDEDEYEWWKEFLKNYESDEQEIEELVDELGIDKTEFWSRVSNGAEIELDLHHYVIQTALKEIREEYDLHKTMK